MNNSEVTFGIFGADITEFLPDELIEKTGRVFEVFVSDMVPTHLCELTPSYYMEVLRVVAEKEISEEIDNQLMDICCNSDNCCFHVSTAMKLPHEIQKYQVTEDESEKDLYEEFREYHQGNHTFHPIQ
jgi:hypothetical protein